MTVKELTDKLQEFSPDSEVKVIFEGDNPVFGDGNPITETYEIIGHSQWDAVYIEA